MLYALLLFLPALVGIAYVLHRARRRHVIVAEAVAAPETISGDVDAISALETLLAELERATLDERDVEELERLAEQLEATAAELFHIKPLERVG